MKFSEWLNDRDPELLEQIVQEGWTDDFKKWLLTHPDTGRDPYEDEEMKQRARELTPSVQNKGKRLSDEEKYSTWSDLTKGGTLAKDRKPGESPKITFKRHQKKIRKTQERGRKDFKQRYGTRPELVDTSI